MNILLPIQLFLSLFLLFAVSRAFLRFKEGVIGLGAFLFWVGLWMLAIISIFYPAFTSYIADLMGIGRGADIIIYLSIALLFYLVFRIHVMIENLEEKISRLIREIALKDKQK